MITAEPTANLTGITLEGEYADFSEIVYCIYRITGLEEDYTAPYWSVKNRLLGMCYDIRHASQGDRDVKLVDNGVYDELMKWHSMALPKQNVHYAVNLLFPEALFVALSVPELSRFSRNRYGEKPRKHQEKGNYPYEFVENYQDYYRDRAILDLLSGVILSALAEVIGDVEYEKLMRQYEFPGRIEYLDYAAQYVDKCNIEYLKTDPEKRKDKLRNIAKRLIKKPAAYNNLLDDLYYSAHQQGCSIHELRDPALEYPEDVEW